MCSVKQVDPTLVSRFEAQATAQGQSRKQAATPAPGAPAGARQPMTAGPSQPPGGTLLTGTAGVMNTGKTSLLGA